MCWLGYVFSSTQLNYGDLTSCAVKIPLPPMDEKKKVIEDVDKDRRYAIDASIVRIMKSRKVLPHQQLMLECVEQLGRMFKVTNNSCLQSRISQQINWMIWHTNFYFILKPDFKIIKKRIEDLIAREYLERDSENPNVFRYLA